MISELKDKYFPVLDHGFISLKDFMGNDQAIVEMARCSYGSGTKAVSSDRGLIRTLMRENHTSPFERCEIVFHVGLPIFVARQWIRHRTANVNEYSGRYSVMPMLFYKPSPERMLKQHQINKQGSSQILLSDDERDQCDAYSGVATRSAVNAYGESLKCDLSRELARIDLPLSMYTYWYWKIDVHNLLHFLKLRLDEHAQWEIRQYAIIIAGIVKKWLPLTWEAFEDYILGGVTFSRLEQKILEGMRYHGMDDTDARIYAESLGLSNREVESFLLKIRFDDKVTNYVADISGSLPASFYEKLIKENSIEE